MKQKLTPRTKFLIENPAMIRAVGSQSGVPQKELDDFSQYVLLRSMTTRDDYDPSRSSISTYSTQFIQWCATRFRKELKKNPLLLDDLQKPN